jgi:NAD-dependent SIR2 family protein deacetylase
MNEMPKDDELVALRERVETLEDVCRLLYAKLTEMESGLVQTHERLSLVEACWERARNLLKVVTDAVDALVRRAGGKPPAGPFPLSGVN